MRLVVRVGGGCENGRMRFERETRSLRDDSVVCRLGRLRDGCACGNGIIDAPLSTFRILIQVFNHV